MEQNSTDSARVWQFTMYSEQHLMITSISLGFFIICCIFSNCLVIAAVLLERSLQNVANYPILSLAITDLLITLLVMPFSVVNEISQYWFLPQAVCEVWLSLGVVCSTASIWHLLAIAIDRCWSVRSLAYVRRRSVRHILIMVLIVWGMSFVVAIPHILGLHDVKSNLEREGQCGTSWVSQTGLSIFFALGSFYLPMGAMLFIYARMYLAVKSRIRFKSTPSLSYVTSSPARASDSHQQGNLELKRERKAARTLTIVTGVALFCWLPFFSMLILDVAVGVTKHSPPELFRFFNWLGYLNSMIDPVIYTIFSPNFRTAFEKIIFRKCIQKRRKKSFGHLQRRTEEVTARQEFEESTKRYVKKHSINLTTKDDIQLASDRGNYQCEVETRVKDKAVSDFFPETESGTELDLLVLCGSPAKSRTMSVNIEEGGSPVSLG